MQAIERPGPEDYSPDPEKLLKVALKLLVRAKDALATKQAVRDYMAGEAITRAVASTREALKLLAEEEEEEMCQS